VPWPFSLRAYSCYRHLLDNLISNVYMPLWRNYNQSWVHRGQQVFGIAQPFWRGSEYLSSTWSLWFCWSSISSFQLHSSKGVHRSVLAFSLWTKERPVSRSQSLGSFSHRPQIYTLWLSTFMDLTCQSPLVLLIRSLSQQEVFWFALSRLNWCFYSWKVSALLMLVVGQ